MKKTLNLKISMECRGNYELKNSRRNRDRVDREGRHKGGVLILVKNSIPARDFKVGTAIPPGSENRQAEINGVVATVKETCFRIYNALLS